MVVQCSPLIPYLAVGSARLSFVDSISGRENAVSCGKITPGNGLGGESGGERISEGLPVGDE